MVSSRKSAWLLTQGVVLPTLRKATKGLLHGKKVLDVACSTGNEGGFRKRGDLGETTRQLVRWGAKYTYGFDKDEEMVKIARQRYGHVKEMRFAAEDMLQFNEPNTFDLATAMNAYNYLDSWEKISTAFKNVRESLKEDGVLIGMVPNGIPELNPREEDAKRLGSGLEMPTEPWRDGLPTKLAFFDGEDVGQETVYFYFRETYAELLLEAGFQKVEWWTPSIGSQALSTYGDDYFHHYLTPPKDIVFRAFKKWQK